MSVGSCHPRIAPNVRARDTNGAKRGGKDYAARCERGNHLGLQLAALRDAGVEKVFEETASGGGWDRPELHRLLDQLRPGDAVVVWKLDRLSRSLRDLVLLLERAGERGATLRSLTEAIETASRAGRMLGQMLGAVAEFERAILNERTRAGLEIARAAGRVGGRRRSSGPNSGRARSRRSRPGNRPRMWALILGVHRGTIARMPAETAARGQGTAPPVARPIR